MFLKLQSALLSLSVMAANAEETLVLHSSGRQRREATIARQTLATVKQHERIESNHPHCSSIHRAFCLIDNDCCGDMQCLFGVGCGHSPGREDEFCSYFYPCDHDRGLFCHWGRCTEWHQVLRTGSEGTCKEGSPPGQLKVMTWNAFLGSCVTGTEGFDIPCQAPEVYEIRIEKLLKYMAQRDEDVVVFQELFNLQDEVVEGMANAGFCHYVTTPVGGNGDGTAIFSKYPIEEVDFEDYFDFSGENSEFVIHEEAVVPDRGIMYAKIMKDGDNYHVFNTRTISNSGGEQYLMRLPQYMAMRMFAEKIVNTTEELVLFAGDLNENKFNEHVGDKLYQGMLEELDAVDPSLEGDMLYSYDTIEDPLLASFKTKGVQERLDYVLVSNKGLNPKSAYCEILKPQYPLDCGGTIGCMLSDHFPVTCTFESFDNTNLSTAAGAIME